MPPQYQGLIDAEKEISKLAGKKADLQKQILRLHERMYSPDYAAKVPSKVQEGDAAKVADAPYLNANPCHVMRQVSSVFGTGTEEWGGLKLPEHQVRPLVHLRPYCLL